MGLLDGLLGIIGLGGGNQQQQQQGGAGAGLGGLGQIAGSLLGGPLGGLAGGLLGNVLGGGLLGGGGGAQQGAAGLNPAMLAQMMQLGAPMMQTLGGNVLSALPQQLMQQQLAALQGQQLQQGIVGNAVGALNPQLSAIQQQLQQQATSQQATAEHRSMVSADQRHREIMAALNQVRTQVGGAGLRRF